MRPSYVTIALVAAASSLLTVAATEVLRGSRAAAGELRTEAAPPVAEQRTPASRNASLPAATADAEADARLLELERRIAALEIDAKSERAPVAVPIKSPARDDELRGLVLAWVDEERDARARAALLDKEEQVAQKLEFEARYAAHALADEHDLADWQEERFVELFTELQTRQRELKREFDPATNDPEQLQEQWSEFGEWAEQRKRDVAFELGADVYASMYGEDK